MTLKNFEVLITTVILSLPLLQNSVDLFQSLHNLRHTRIFCD